MSELREGIVCDLCGAKGTVAGQAPFGETYNDGNVYEATVSITSGWHYSNDRVVTTRAWHVCPPCFESRIVPLFGGAPPTVTEW